MKNFSTFQPFNIFFCRSIILLSFTMLGIGCHDDSETGIPEETIVENRTLCDGETLGDSFEICNIEIVNGECCVTICNLDRWNGCYVSLSFVQIGTPPSTLYPISNGMATFCLPLDYNSNLKIWIYCAGFTYTCKDFGQVGC